MTNMRAKVKLNAIQPNQGSETLTFNPVCKTDGYDKTKGLDEDNTFAKYSPSGQFIITITNPALLGAFNVGETYYVDFTPVPAPEPEKAAGE